MKVIPFLSLSENKLMKILIQKIYYNNNNPDIPCILSQLNAHH